MRERITLDTHDKFFMKDGKYYILSDIKDMEDKHKLVFVQVNKKDYDNKIKELAKRIAALDVLKLEKIIEASLKNGSLDSLDKIEKALNQKKKAKVRSGCLELSVGHEALSLVG